MLEAQMAIFTGTISVPTFEYDDYGAIELLASWDCSYTCTITLEIKPLRGDYGNLVPGYYQIVNTAAVLSADVENTYTYKISQDQPDDLSFSFSNFEVPVYDYGVPIQDLVFKFEDEITLGYEYDIYGDHSKSYHVNFVGNWNSKHTQLSGEIDVSVQEIIFNIQGTWNSLGEFYQHVPLTLTGSPPPPPPHKETCLYDINKDGKSTGMERLYSVVCSRDLSFDKKIAALQPAIDQIKSLIGQTKDQIAQGALSQAAESAFYITELLTFGESKSAKLVGDIAQGMGDAAQVGGMIKNAWEFANGNTQGEAVANAVGDSLSILAESAKHIVEYLPVVSLAYDTVKFAVNTIEFGQALAELEINLADYEEKYHALQEALKQAEADRDAKGFKCVAHFEPANARHAKSVDLASVIDENDARLSWERTALSVLPDGSHGGNLAKPAGGISTPKGKIITVVDSDALHTSNLPDGLNVALGNKPNDIIHATGGDLDGDVAVCWIATGAGNDRILVSAGAISIVDPSGNDSVFVRDGTGSLASIDDILTKVVDPSDPKAVTLAVGTQLFVDSQGIENFTFAEGTYHLVNGELQFQAGDENVLTIKGTNYNDTITGGSLADQLLGLAGNDKLNGGAGDDIPMAAPERMFSTVEMATIR